MVKQFIGTGQDQVPVNGMLGDLAFQSKESIKFTDGEGALSALTLNPIYKQITQSAVDVFVYDTRKDSDGGAWRKRCGHTSWYNETLGTSTRGVRKDFPSVAVLVATASSLIIYDGDDATLPMWMVFNCTFQGYGQASTMLGNVYGSSSANNTLTSVVMLNAEMWIGKRGTYNNVEYSSVNFIKFIADMGGAVGQTYGNGTTARNATFAGNIAQRNATSIYSNGVYDKYSSGIATEGVNDVAMTVLPGAPIDQTTGLPTPTIAVATLGALSVLKDNGAVYNISGPNWGANSLTVAFDNGGTLYFSQMSYYWIACDVKGLNQSYSNLVDGRSYYQSSVDTYPFKQISCFDGNGWGASLDPATSTGSDFNFAHYSLYTAPFGRVVKHYNTKGLDTYLGSTQLMNYTAPTYNTGWMIGDILGAWMSDTTQETMQATNLVTNSDMSSGISGYVTYNATYSSVSLSGGACVATALVAGQLNGCVYNVTGLIPGRQYYIQCDFSTTSTTSDLRIQIGGIGLRNASAQFASASGTRTVSDTFTATSTSHGIEFLDYAYGVSGRTFSIDNVIMKLADNDRSVRGNGLAVVGSINKAPVAAGADLVSYAGWSSASYLSQPYNTSLNIGTGDFSVNVWTKWIAGTVNFIFQRGTAVNTSEMCLYVDSTGSIVGRVYSSGNGLNTPANSAPSGNVWFMLTFIKRSGTLYMYVNGKLVGSRANSETNTINAPLIVGCWTNNASYTGNEMALMRFSANAPSDDQIVKMYNDEKVLFQDNAKACIYGTSDAITALAYDEDTKLLHVGTSAGRSIFQGLRRVDNTTTAVSTVISAANGLVAEQ